jgi:hypothetical protein
MQENIFKVQRKKIEKKNKQNRKINKRKKKRIFLKKIYMCVCDVRCRPCAPHHTHAPQNGAHKKKKKKKKKVGGGGKVITRRQ